MTIRKLNVLVYTGTGAASESTRHCIFSLRQLLSPNYAVIPISETLLLKEPWPQTCALLVFPGGADLGYCRVLNGEGNRRINDYVRRGGSYLGFCAGSYYGSKRCEFEVGNQLWSEKGAKAVSLKINKSALGSDAPERTASYFNGGGVFVDASKLGSKVEVLAEYEDELDVDGGEGKAAVVLCVVGNGKAIVTGPHPEFAAVNLSPKPDIPDYDALISRLADSDRARLTFLRACLEKLGLEPNAPGSTIPPLSTLHLSSINNTEVAELLCSWDSIMEKEDGAEWIRGEGDTFRLKNEDDTLNMNEFHETLPDDYNDHIFDYEKIVKKIVPHEEKLPTYKQTPNFSHERFFDDLKRFRRAEKDAETWGNVLMYGNVVTSTNTLLEKNPKILSNVPTGFTLAASTQVAGRGRGTNVWIAPPGSLIHSTVINHPAHLAVSRPIVFIQYVASIAIVEAIQSYAPSYEKLPVKIKWPNDIYALDPSKPDSKEYVKIGGMLSQCGYFDGAYQIVLGIGLNTINPRPTTSISDLIPPGVAPLHIETLLARLLTRLEAVHAQFIREGFSHDLETRYYRHWLHTGQLVTLEAEGNVHARVVGITKDWGMLHVEQTDREGRGTGKMWALQSDENSFDYWKGLVRRKT